MEDLDREFGARAVGCKHDHLLASEMIRLRLVNVRSMRSGGLGGRWGFVILRLGMSFNTERVAGKTRHQPQPDALSGSCQNSSGMPRPVSRTIDCWSPSSWMFASA